jgi:hypothetical protein
VIQKDGLINTYEIESIFFNHPVQVVAVTVLKFLEQFNPPGIVCFELRFLLASLFQTVN